ncbi:MAG: amidohydrolase family protein [Planctomycetes bacterium]|nr:amidohydrolase family protein [Planctomycetota bacterium]
MDGVHQSKFHRTGAPLRGTRITIAVLLALFPEGARAQTAPTDGIENRRPEVHALTGARVYATPEQVLEQAAIVLRDGLIESAGGPVPPDARVWDRTGCTITAGFIDLDFRLQVPAVPAGAERVARSWNSRIQPERDAALALPLPAARAAEHRGQGFTLALVAPEDGILAGLGSLVTLGDAEPREAIVAAEVAHFASLAHGGEDDRGYPNSRMGAVALLRQTLYDAAWYRDAWRRYAANPAGATPPEFNASLAALLPVLEGKLPLALRTADPLELLSVARVVDEFRLRAWYLGNGAEYQWLGDVAALSPEVVLPVAFPEAPRIARPEDAARVSLRELESWARAPENAARLAGAGIRFALTPRGLKSPKDFSERVRRMRDRGLSLTAVLDALTVAPARILGLQEVAGTVAPGKLACLAVFDGEPFAEKTNLIEVWIDGRRYPVIANLPPDLRGEWEALLVAGKTYNARFRLSGDRLKPEIKFLADGAARAEIKATLQSDGNSISMTFDGAAFGVSGIVLAGATADGARGQITGTALLADGRRGTLTAHRHAAGTGAPEPKMGAAGEAEAEAGAGSNAARELWRGSASEVPPVPLGPRGRSEPAFAPPILCVKDAHLWTCGPERTIANGDMIVEGGKIAAVGRDLAPPAGAHVIDGTGLHVTPGIIDVHSHTAIAGGVNESSQSVTSEVRIGDVVRPDDVGLYRELAGGLTTALLLHGSANPIGGQTQVIKLRWGESAEGLKLREAPPTIKFALGENVKQSNWGDAHTTRYPQTRMGVEQLIRDRFLAAKAYAREWAEFRAAEREAAEGPAGAGGAAAPAAPRRDLELDALVEILEGRRHIHCHSYRQDEILMLIRLAEEIGFKVNTFQHVLEGYKVAPEIAAHGASCSAFSDWWAYKFEVYDAIPYNGALLAEAGVVTTFNSDSDEMARRLNLEAAKTIKYGGLAPEEALLFVTLNAARQLHLERQIGSLEPGKDADFVIWSGDPLSTYTICLETWIEGEQMFSRAADRTLAARDGERKNLLVQRLLDDFRSREKKEEKKAPADAAGGTVEPPKREGEP